MLRPEPGTVLLWLLGVVLVVGLDLLLTAAPARISVTRRAPGTVRLTDPASSQLVVTNQHRRGVRLEVRDAWQPSAGARDNRHRLRLAAGEVRRLTTPLLPRRRGDLRAAGVTTRSWGPLGLAARQRTYDVAGTS